MFVGVGVGVESVCVSERESEMRLCGSTDPDVVRKPQVFVQFRSEKPFTFPTLK